MHYTSQTIFLRWAPPGTVLHWILINISIGTHFLWQPHSSLFSLAGEMTTVSRTFNHSLLITADFSIFKIYNIHFVNVQNNTSDEHWKANQPSYLQAPTLALPNACRQIEAAVKFILNLRSVSLPVTADLQRHTHNRTVLLDRCAQFTSW